MTLRGLYAITAPLQMAPGDLAQQVRDALGGGARLIQYRDKSHDTVRRRAEENARHLEGARVEVLVGLARSSSAGETPPETLIEQVRLVGELGAAGAAIFHLDKLGERDMELLAGLR